MNFKKLITIRESVRDYDPTKEVPTAVLNSILEAGRLAPSAANRQPWKFIVVSSTEWLEKIRPCYEKTWFQNAPHILIVKGSRKEAWVRKTDGYIALETDLTIAMDHMILAAANEGVGTCWIGAFDRKYLREVLGLNEDEEIFTITPLGYPTIPTVPRVKKRKPMEEIVQFL